MYQSICFSCGKTFESELPNRLFCSTECRELYNSIGSYPDKTCRICGEPFQPSVHNQVVCRNCQKKRYALEHPNSLKYHPIERRCIICSKEFKPLIHNQLVCSDECRKYRIRKSQIERLNRAFINLQAKMDGLINKNEEYKRDLESLSLKIQSKGGILDKEKEL